MPEILDIFAPWHISEVLDMVKAFEDSAFRRADCSLV